MKIPFNKPFLTGNEMAYMQEAVRLGHASGDGTFTAKCRAWLNLELGVVDSLLTTSCTHALEMAAMLLDIQPGDEVIIPSFTFVSTVNAFVVRGAKPIFVDVRADTLCLDESKVEAALTPRTKAIVPVHYAGVACEMDRLLEISRRRNVAIVEDNAHGLFAKYKGRSLGTFGALATLSFHETKNVSCGEGGALLINDPALRDRAEIIREKGTDRSRFFRGQVDKYGWVDVGSSYLPSDLLAAYLFAQLEGKDDIQKRRQTIWERYHAELKGWAAKHGIGLPTIPTHTQQPFHLYYLMLNSLEERTALIAHLKGRGILSAFHYQPLHSSLMGKKFGGVMGSCPITEKAGDRLLRLPLYASLSASEQASVVESILEFSPAVMRSAA